jgi:hypothetical protein
MMVVHDREGILMATITQHPLLAARIGGSFVFAGTGAPRDLRPTIMQT